MGKIDIGNFGDSTQDVAPQADTSAIGRGIESLGANLEDAGNEIQQQRRQMAAAQASNALLDHEISVKQVAQNVTGQLTRGEVDPNDAQKAYDEQVSQIDVPDINNLGGAGKEAYSRGVKRLQFESGLVVNTAADATRRDQYKAQLDIGLDNVSKLAGMPGADIPALSAQMDSFAPVGKAAGLKEDEVAVKVQNAKDQMWLNDATRRYDDNTDNLAGLKQLQGDLTKADGSYVDKLDINKRNGILRAVVDRQDVLMNRYEHQADKRDAAGERAINQMDVQNASGIPPTADMMTGWAAATTGTSSADDFKQRVADGKEIQTVLRMPVQQQIDYVSKKQAALLAGGGSVKDAEHIARLGSTVQQNVTTLQTNPLQFNAARNGAEIDPIDFSNLGSPDGLQTLAAQFHDRATTITAMQKQYGPQVQLHPLTPDESKTLAGALSSASPAQAADIFGRLRNAAGSDDVYTAMMQQVAPDAPVRALAGLLAAKQRTVTLQRNLISQNKVATSPDVATTMLAGEDLLNKSKAQKASDGKPSTGLYLPETAPLQQAFTDAVGGAFAGSPASAQHAFEAVQAYYVGKAAQTGRLASSNKDIDTDLVQEAIAATVGKPVNYNGNGMVLAPWGMDDSEFNDKVHAAATIAAKQYHLPPGIVSQLPQFGLENFGDGTYLVKAKRGYLHDDKGNPVVIDLNKVGNGTSGSWTPTTTGASGSY